MTTSIHVIAGLAQEHGGPSYSVPRLCRALEDRGEQVQLVTIAQSNADLPAGSRGFVQSFVRTPLLSDQRLSGALRRFLSEAAQKADIVHNHGLWLAPNLYAGHAAHGAGVPLVVSARGMLAEAALRYSKRKKRLYWSLFQGPAIRHAAGWHATSHQEAEDIRAFGVERAPIAVIPNGVDVPDWSAGHERGRIPRRLLFLSRIHRHKGLITLLDAWAKIEPDYPEWELVIAGPDADGHQSDLQRQAAMLGLTRIAFRGPLFGADRDKLVASVDLFVLPSRSENFGIVVAEALAAGLPAIVTKGAPWAGLHDHRCGWWIDHGVAPLVAALRQAIALPSGEREAMGARGRVWMSKSYSWDAVGTHMSQFYKWLMEQGDRPNFVQDGG